MGSLWDLHAVQVEIPAKKRPQRLAVSRQHWREQALRRLWILAREVGLGEKQVLGMIGLQDRAELTLPVIGRLTRELASWNRSTWD